MTDIANCIKAYLSKSGMSLDEVKSKLSDFGNSFYNVHVGAESQVSLFDINENTNMTQDEFENLLKKASSTGLSEFSENDIQMLMDIIDIDDDNSLSYDELQFLAKDGEISRISLWHGLICSNLTEADLIDNGTGSSTAGGSTGSSTAGGSTGSSTAGGSTGSSTESGSTGSSTESGSTGSSTEGGSTGSSTVGGSTGSPTVGGSTDSPTVGGNETESPANGNGVNTYTNAEISELKNKIDSILTDGGGAYKCPEDIISHWLENGDITDEMADNLRAEYTLYNEDDEKTIRQIMNVDNLTRAEAIKVAKEKKLLKNPPLSEPNKSVSEIKSAASTININIDQYVEDLHEAMEGFAHTDESELKAILNSSISDDEFVEIVKAYEKKYGLDSGGRGLVTMLEKETSGSLQTELTTVLANRLASAAMNGNSDAVDLICKEVYSGTAGQHCTANDFLETIFLSNVLSDDIIAKIADRYSNVNSGHNLIDDIKADYDGLGSAWGYLFGYGKGGDMIARIKEARRNN